VRGCTSETARGAAGRAGEAASGPEKETRRSELLDATGLIELLVRIAAASSRVRPPSSPASRARPSSMRARAWFGFGFGFGFGFVVRVRVSDDG
jgi:hypothetical protein